MTTYFQRVSNATDVNKLGLSYVDKQFDIKHFSLFIVASIDNQMVTFRMFSAIKA